MSVIKKGDEPKVYALIGGIVVVMFVAWWKVNGIMHPADDTPPPPVASAPSVAPVATVASPAPVDNSIELPPVISSTTIDPFRAVVAKYIPPPASTAPPTRTMPAPFTGSASPLPGSVSPLPITLPTKPLPPPEQIVQLDGVMPGKEPVAVLHVGSQSYVLRQGEKFGDGYVLVSVGKDAVKISHRSKTVSVGLGK